MQRSLKYFLIVLILGFVVYGIGALKNKDIRDASHSREKTKVSPLVMAKRLEALQLTEFSGIKTKDEKIKSAKQLLSMLKDECENPTSIEPSVRKDFTQSMLLKDTYMGSLGSLGKDVIPVLKKTLNDGNEEFQKRVVIVLGAFKDESVFQKLITMMLKDDSWHIRALSAKALGAYQVQKSAEFLQKALRDPYCVKNEADYIPQGKEEICPVREAAFTSLLKMGYRWIPSCPPNCSFNDYNMRKLTNEELLEEKRRMGKNIKTIKEYSAKSVEQLLIIMKTQHGEPRLFAIDALSVKIAKNQLSKEQEGEFLKELGKAREE